MGAVLLLAWGGVGCGSDEDRLQTFMKRGDAYVEKRSFDEAIIEYKNVLQIDPNHAPAHEALSLAYLQVNKPRDAYWEMSETVRLDPDNVDARLRYGTVAAAAGDPDLALEQAEAVLDRSPNNPKALVLRAQARETKEDLEGAEADFSAAIEADPEGAAYRFLKLGFLERQGRRAEAEKVARELVELEPSFLAASTLARMVMASGERDEEAERLLERAVEIARDAPEKRSERRPGRPVGETSLMSNVERADAIRSAYLLLSAFHYDRGRFERSIEVLEEGVESAGTGQKADLIYQMARLYRLQGREDKADELLRRATTADPDDPNPQLVLSAYLGAQGDLEGALEAATRAVEIAPDNRAAQLRKAELLVDLGYQQDDTAAIAAGRELVDRVLEKEPSSPEAHFVRAKLQLAEGNLQAAQQSLETVIQARPDFAQARFVLGSTLAVEGEIRRARVELARAIEIDPTLAEARRLLVQVHAQLGEHEFVIEQGRRYLSQSPDDVAIRIVVGQSLIQLGRGEEAYEEVSKIPEESRDAAAYFALGRLDLAFGRKEQGTRRLLRANEMSPGNPQVLRMLLAVDQQNGELEKSRERIEAAVDTDPENPQLIELLAQLHVLDGDTAAARAGFERSLELDPANEGAHAALADLARRDGSTQEWVRTLENAVSAIPNSANLQYRLATAYEQLGRHADAIATYERVVALNDDLYAAKNNLAYLLAETGGDLDRALALAQAAKEQVPDDPNTADTLGWVLVKRGVPSAGIGYLEEAAERFPETAFEVQGIVRNHLAEAYERNGEPSKALAASRESIRFHERLVREARERGAEVGEEPDWVRDARSRIGRLQAAS